MKVEISQQRNVQQTRDMTSAACIGTSAGFTSFDVVILSEAVRSEATRGAVEGSLQRNHSRPTSGSES